MPNWCDFKCKVVCDKAENIEEFISYITNEYDEGRHFWGCFSESLDNGDYTVLRKDDKYFTVFDAYCAWSVYCAMFDGEHTDQRDAKRALERGEEAAPNGITLAEATKNLSLKVEIFSREIGVGFAEHIIADNGKILVDEVDEGFRKFAKSTIEAVCENHGLSVDDSFETKLAWFEENKIHKKLIPLDVTGLEWYRTQSFEDAGWSI